MGDEDLTRWILSVDRRILVLKAVDATGPFSAADIAERSGRSVQNISRALHELEEKGLVERLDPGKQTWKRYLLTCRGEAMFEKVRSISRTRQGP
jgi:predicted transcriptional regulator